MSVNQTNKVFFLILIFLGIGITILLLTHDLDNNIDNQIVEEVVDYTAYIQDIRPWLATATNDLTAIQNIKGNLESFSSLDSFVGQVHVNLYLAFDSWEQYLLTDNNKYKQETIKKLTVVADLVPGLTEDIANLKSILN